MSVPAAKGEMLGDTLVVKAAHNDVYRSVFVLIFADVEAMVSALLVHRITAVFCDVLGGAVIGMAGSHIPAVTAVLVPLFIRKGLPRANHAIYALHIGRTSHDEAR